MPDFTTAELAALRAGLPRFGLFFHFATTPAVRDWAGVGDIKPGINAVDLSDGATYKGRGEIVEYDDILNLFDGTSSRIALGLQRIPVNAFASVSSQLPALQAAVQGKEIFIGWVAMDADWRPMSAVHWEWSGFGDGLTAYYRAANSADGPAVAGLSLSCGDIWTGMRRPGLSFMADNDQRARGLILNPGEPEDRFCERVGRYSVGTEKPLPINP